MSWIRRACLLVSLALLAVAVIWILIQSRSIFRRPVSAPIIIQLSIPEIQRAWRKDVTAILKTYDQDGRATVARDALMQLRVAGADREVHLELALAFYAISAGKKDGAARLTQARAAFNAAEK